MNTPLFAHLWKEWREQRAALLQLAIVIAIGVLLADCLLPSEQRSDPTLRQVAALLPLVIVSATVVPDLLSRERKNGGIEFLARTPGGLRNAWITKLVFAFLLIGVALIVGEFAADSICTPISSTPDGQWTPASDPTSALILAVLVAWTFTASAWLSNGLLALPCAILLTIATIAPALSMTADADRTRIGVMFFTLVPLGAFIGLCGSWFAFVGGPRRGRSRRWITAVGGGASLLGLIPSAAPAAIRLGFPPRSVVVEPVALTDDGVFLFHRVVRSGSPNENDSVTLFEVDLRTREVREDDASVAITRVLATRHLAPVNFRGLDPIIGATSELQSLAASIGSERVPSEHPDPAEFGRGDITSGFSIDCEGAGQRLHVYSGKTREQYFRNRSGSLCFSLQELDELAGDCTVMRVVPTTTTSWLALDVHRVWWWLDVFTGERERCDALVRTSGSSVDFGPSTASGLLLACDDDGLKLIDANTRNWQLVAGAESVSGVSCVLDEHACKLLRDDASVWLGVYVGASWDEHQQAAYRIDIDGARVTERIAIEDPRAHLLAANDDGVLYLSRESGDVNWFDRASRETRSLVVAER